MRIEWFVTDWPIRLMMLRPWIDVHPLLTHNFLPRKLLIWSSLDPKGIRQPQAASCNLLYACLPRVRQRNAMLGNVSCRIFNGIIKNDMSIFDRKFAMHFFLPYNRSHAPWPFCEHKNFFCYHRFLHTPRSIYRIKKSPCQNCILVKISHLKKNCFMQQCL